MFKAKTVVNKITVPSTAKLELVKGEGYWYFVYDDVINNKYDTHSEYVFYLNSLDLDNWVDIGTKFVERMKGE
ncbi:hypothetical protein FDI40_gp551 [Agrobacterium phage Atu_ph07]|uniref:Uncharacterized protein n=1 Tax=Agrobacterium phage Atu_ph07 TaxID=2024264 RepID=A0A2L0V0L6_9CAUD|nr:hypothetical protein FDI40_gp551 [Agrobacterium phage Atu_ph07]AUZ95310.1 hypothetical protein [Agrobacterium phage Atu_ph07]